MITVQLPDREPLVMSAQEARQLYDLLWDNATTVRGSVSAAAQIRAALALTERLRKPVTFDGAEAVAVAAALDPTVERGA